MSKLSDITTTSQIAENIKLVSKENTELKVKLLNLINDYKLLKQFVLNDDKSSKKRSFNEIETENFTQTKFEVGTFDTMELIDSVLKLIDEIAEPKPVESEGILDFIEDEEIDDDYDMDSPLLSRTSSPLDDENNLLMASLTRSTTVSTNNSFYEKPSHRFFELPKYSSGNSVKNASSKFDVLQQDKYNLINDFLEEKLIDNEVTYYESLHNQ